MTTQLTLVFEYITANLFNAYLEEMPFVRVELKTIDQCRREIRALLGPQMEKIKDVKLFFPKNLYNKMRDTSDLTLVRHDN